MSCKIIPTKITKSEKYWEHRSKRGVLTNKEYDIFYDRAIPLGQYLKNNANRPDIIIHNKNIREIKIIEFCIINEFGILNTTPWKICKYTDFNNFIKREWNLKSIEFIPIIVGVMGIYNESLKNIRKYKNRRNLRESSKIQYTYTKSSNNEKINVHYCIYCNIVNQSWHKLYN